MDDKLILKLSVSQRQLLLDYRHYILELDIVRAISVAIKKSSKYEVYLSYEDFEELIGYVCAIANHEENKKIADKFHCLADYLEDCFAKYE
ncbi:hypothetical protein ACFL3G_11300 [Planctomycetota bacterium]